MYDPIFAKSFSRYEQKRFGFWAVLISMIMVVSICMEFKPHFHPLSLIGNAMNLKLSINAAQQYYMLVPKNKGISSPLIETEAKVVEPTNTLKIKATDIPPQLALATKAKDAEPVDKVIIKDKDPPPLKTEAKEVEPPKRLIMKDRGIPSQLANQANEVEQECNFSGPMSDYCDMKGDIRIEAKSSTIFIVSRNRVTKAGSNIINSWSIKPYARKGNTDAMISVKNWTVKLVGRHDDDDDDRENYNINPVCSQNHSTTPAILFSTGGYSGNTFHDFSDILVPIFSTSQEFNGEVHFLATDYAKWWISKYKMFFSKLSKHPIVPIDEENQIHCYSRLILGLKSHKELDIDPSKFPNNAPSMTHFRRLLRGAYSLERTKAIKPKKGDGRKPRLMLISRAKTRIITNQDDITRLARKLGFEVIVAEAKISTNMTSFAELVNSCDVLMGVHGAGLTNMVFLPDNAVLIQIIPLGGIDGFARNDFGKPSIDMNINYLEYKIQVTESSLIQQYPLDHAVFRDPFSIHRQGWGVIRSIFLDKQDVRIDLRRFRSTLAKAIKILRRH